MGILETIRMLGYVARSAWHRVLNLMTREGILLIRYVAVRTASPQKYFGTLVDSIRDLATSII